MNVVLFRKETAEGEGPFVLHQTELVAPSHFSDPGSLKFQLNEYIKRGVRTAADT